MADQNLTYDAFISYRHFPADKAIATRLQNLLENYRPPGGVERRQIRIFRDQSELPTSGDLGNDIRNALEHSGYLIVVCSEATKESRWCMEEIRYFKSLHGGSNSHILPLIISGEPGEVFPEELTTETYSFTDEDGNVRSVEREVEPLCADVRADSMYRQKKLLKTEFLRLIAPILGCPFDALYQRHQRRKTRRLVTGGLAALALVSSFAVYSTSLLNQISGKQKQLLTNESKSLSFYSGQERQNGDLRLAMLLAREALPKDFDHPERPFLTEAETALRNAVTQRLYMEASRPYYMDFSVSSSVDDIGLHAVSEDESLILLTDYTAYYLYDSTNGMLLEKWDADTISYDPALRYVLIGENNILSLDGGTDYRLIDTLTGEVLYTAGIVPKGNQLYTIYDPDKDQFYIYEWKDWRVGSVTCRAVIGADGNASPPDTVDPLIIEELLELSSYTSNNFNYTRQLTSPSGAFFAYYPSSDSPLEVIDTSSGEVLYTFKTYVSNLHFSPDEQYMTAVVDGNVFVYRLPSNPSEAISEVVGFPAKSGYYFESAQLSYDNNLLAIVFAVDATLEVRTLFLDGWNKSNDPIVTSLPGIVSFSSKSPNFFVQSDGQVAKYNYNPDHLGKNGDREKYIGQLYLSDTGKSALSVTGETTFSNLSLYDTATGRKIVNLTSADNPNVIPYLAKPIYFYRGNGKLLCYTQEGNLTLWGGDTSACLWDIPLKESPQTVCVSEEGDMVACGMEDGTIEIRSALDGSVQNTLSFTNGKPERVEMAAGRLLVFNENVAAVYDLSTGKKILSKRADNEGFHNFINIISSEPWLTADGLLFLTGVDALSVYNLDTGTELLRERDNGGSYCYSPDLQCLVYRENNISTEMAPYLRVFQLEGDALIERNRIYPKDSQAVFEIDSTGTFLCLNGRQGFELYSLPDGNMRLWIDAQNLTIRDNLICDLGTWDFENGAPLPTIPYLKGKELAAAAGKYLDSGTQPRVLTKEEKERFFIAE